VTTAHELSQRGGPWLAAAREWLRRRKANGHTLTWGSDDKPYPTMSVRDVEDLAAHVAAAVANEYQGVLRDTYHLLVEHHNVGKRIEWGGVCPHCVSADGKSPVLDSIYAALKETM
jgi:hypothetical protein